MFEPSNLKIEVDAILENLTSSAFWRFLLPPLLTSDRSKRYFEWRLTQLNHENQIYQAFQEPGLSIN